VLQSRSHKTFHPLKYVLRLSCLALPFDHTVYKDKALYVYVIKSRYGEYYIKFLPVTLSSAMLFIHVYALSLILES